MTAYIAVSFSKRKLVDKELLAITDCLKKNGITPFIFVDNYNFSNTQEKEMMQQAMNDIKRCDILLAETSEKAIGIGIEVGYAKANHKPVIYLRKNEAEHSTTVSGISDFQVIYNTISDLQKQLSSILKKIMTNHNE
jgi:nucleoside 2-deoxyribosyltransferase